MLPAKRPEEKFVGRHSKRLRNQNEAHLLKNILARTLFLVESTNVIKIKMTCHRVIGDGCICEGTWIMNAWMLAVSVS